MRRRHMAKPQTRTPMVVQKFILFASRTFSTSGMNTLSDFLGQNGHDGRKTFKNFEY